MASIIMRLWRDKGYFAILLSCVYLLAACSTQSSFTTLSLSSNKLAHVGTSMTNSWIAFDNGGSRSGVNTAETKIALTNVNTLTRLWQVHLPATVDGSPVELANVATPSGTHNLLFLTTLTGSLLAVDADTGNLIWQQNTQGVNITTSSPAIDPSGNYVYGYGIDGKVHQYAVGTGAETFNGTWPATITTDPSVEKGSSALNIGNGYLYATTSGYSGDAGLYHGHIVAINLATGAKSIFNVLCSNIRQLESNTPGTSNYCPDIQGGVWGRGGVVLDPTDNYLYVTSGNGAYNANTGGHDFGDSVIKLSDDLMHLVDAYTPSNYAALQANDQDLGSAMPLLLPVQAGSRTPYMAVQAGKDTTLRLLNRKNLSSSPPDGTRRVGGELQDVPLPQGCDVDTQPIAWNDANNVTWVFVANTCGMSAFKVVTNSQGNSSLQFVYRSSNAGSSPLIANNVLFLQGNGVIWAMNPTTGAVLWSSTQASAGGTVGPLHWQSPLVINGRVYVADNSGQLTAYSPH